MIRANLFELEKGVDNNSEYFVFVFPDEQRIKKNFRSRSS